MAKNKLPPVPKARFKDSSQQRHADATQNMLDILAGRKGNGLDRAVLLRDLADAGIASLRVTGAGGGTVDIAGPVEAEGDTSFDVPHAPVNFQAQGAFTNIMLSWDNTTYGKASDAAHTEIWRNSTDDLSTAQMIATTAAAMYADSVGGSASYYYWIRHVNVSAEGVRKDGPYNSSAGTLATTVDGQTFDINAMKLKDGAVVMDAPFYVFEGQIYVDEAMIRQAYIQWLVTDTLVADRISTIWLDAIWIRGGYIDIGDGNFVVDQLGNVTAKSGTFEGTVKADQIIGDVVSKAYIDYDGGPYPDLTLNADEVAGGTTERIVQKFQINRAVPYTRYATLCDTTIWIDAGTIRSGDWIVGQFRVDLDGTVDGQPYTDQSNQVYGCGLDPKDGTSVQATRTITDYTVTIPANFIGDYNIVQLLTGDLISGDYTTLRPAVGISASPWQITVYRSATDIVPVNMAT